VFFFKAPLKRSCPDGVDVHYDNVGGEISDAISINFMLELHYVVR
jgi:NADPH-dependent curcumin reductase CurA